ncbi:MAG: T9SS type A sorting domain-containing protein [Bacteroidia bacterium]
MKKIYLLVVGLIAAFSLEAADINVSDADINTGDTVTWTKDNVYFLTERVFVDSGAVLNIEAGTVVRGNPGTGSNATALIVARGGQIFARGSYFDPIIFTAANDDLANPVDIRPGTKGLWGGLIILGNASLNSTPGSTEIEGLPSGDARSQYGAFPNGDTNDDDNSGVINYVSIRYGGASIAPNNDINGLTLGGVGRGTTVDYVEVIFNFDDGVEFFGGTVNTKHLLVAFCGDDSYDYDEGFRGKGQFWVAIQSDTTGDRCGEHDGGTKPETAQPYATPEIYNATYIGRGGGSGKRMITFRDNAGGVYCNSIFVDQDKGIDIEILGTGTDCYDRYKAGELKLENNIFWNVGGNAPLEIFKMSPDKFNGAPDSLQVVSSSENDIQMYFANANNINQDPLFGSLTSNSRAIGQNALDLRPSSAGPAYTTSLTPYSDPWFTPVNYKGAFAEHGSFWIRGWTFMEQLGYFSTTVSNTPALNENFVVLPNPATNLFEVTAEGVTGDVAVLSLVDLNGRVVLSQEAAIAGNKLNATMNIESLSAGIYMLQASVNGATVATKKVVKQ